MCRLDIRNLSTCGSRLFVFFFFSSRRRHTRFDCDWSSDVCSSDLTSSVPAPKVRHGVVQDKLWVPGLMKLKTLRDLGFFGKILSVRGEFGYWVFEGDTIRAQRPSRNYRNADGRGIIMDMLCHWRYVLDNLFGAVKSVSCVGAAHVA